MKAYVYYNALLHIMIDKATGILGAFVAFMLVSNSSTLLPFEWSVGYYVVLSVTLVYLFTLCIFRRVNITMISLYLVALLSIVCNDVPSFFKPWPRLGTFVLLTAVVSPAFCGKKLVAFRLQMFAYVSILLMLVTLISTGLLLTGRGYGSPFNAYFQGATVHSMIMGPVAALSSVFFAYQLQYKSRIWFMKVLYFAGILCGGLCVLQTGSRAAFIGAVASLVAYMMFRHIKHIGRFYKCIILVGSLLLLSTPLWNSFTDKLLKKNGGEVGALNVDSRQVHWLQRVKEWESSPIIGIGFGSVDEEAEGSTVDRQSGGVETGSSWLCALSMTGILGFTCVLSIFCGAAYRAWCLLKVSPPVGALLLAMMVFFAFHMMAEGYIFAGGNFLNTQLWLLLGTIYGISQYPGYARVLEQKLQLHF